jgi:hypothetical protein
VKVLQLESVTVSDLEAAFDGAERVTSASLAAFLSEETGETVTAHKLARVLRPFGVRPVTARVNGKLAKAYLRSAFASQTETPARPAVRIYSAAEIDRAVAGAWAHFHALNDINDERAWT